MATSFAVGLVTIPIMLFAFLLPIALLVALQVWLCRKNLRLGLILPVLSVLLSLFPTLLIAVNAVGIDVRAFLLLGLVFLGANIPTVVFGGIWLHYKGRQETLDSLKRMQIEDLE